MNANDRTTFKTCDLMSNVFIETWMPIFMINCQITWDFWALFFFDSLPVCMYQKVLLNHFHNVSDTNYYTMIDMFPRKVQIAAQIWIDNSFLEILDQISLNWHLKTWYVWGNFPDTVVGMFHWDGRKAINIATNNSMNSPKIYIYLISKAFQENGNIYMYSKTIYPRW